jgi:hypothetical protein
MVLPAADPTTHALPASPRAPLAVYVAGHLLGDLPRVRAAATAARAAGLRVVSRWHDGEDDRLAAEERLSRLVGSSDARAAIAAANLRDLRAAEAVLWVVHPESRGALVELGVAYERGLRIDAVGEPHAATLMADLPGVRWHGSVAQAVTVLRGDTATESDGARADRLAGLASDDPAAGVQRLVARVGRALAEARREAAFWRAAARAMAFEAGALAELGDDPDDPTGARASDAALEVPDWIAAVRRTRAAALIRGALGSPRLE